MSTFSKLPNLSKAAEKLKIILDLETFITNKAVRTSMGDAILFAIKEQVNPGIIIASIKSDIDAGNPRNVAEVIGENLLKRIENYKLN